MPSPFAERLREALSDSGMTQEGLARELGLSLSGVTQWLNRKSEPRGATLVQIARVLDRNPAWFFSEPESEAA